MSTAESEAIKALQSERDLPRGMVEALIERMLSGECSTADMQRLLVGLQSKGETVEELVGAATAMRRAMVRVACDFPVVLDTCGTGGDGSQTFNISTAAAIVIAAAGVPVAKHGNRKVTSSTGSADVLAELGVDLDAPPHVVERCLNELKLCFCFAQRFHPAMKHVAEVRRSIKGPTIFNRLGPLCNPASANRQVLGVGSTDLQVKLGAALAELGTERSLIVRGQDGVDEVSSESPTNVLQVSSCRDDASTAVCSSSHPGADVTHSTGSRLTSRGSVSSGPITKVRSERWLTWQPSDFGLASHTRQALFADSPATSADCIREALSGRAGAYRDAVLINAAAGLWLAGVSPELTSCVSQAAEAIDTGHAIDLLHRLGQMTKSVQ